MPDADKDAIQRVPHARGTLSARTLAAIALAGLLTLMGGGCGVSEPRGAGEPFWRSLTPVAIEASGYESKAHGGWADFPPAFAVDGSLDARSSWRAEAAGPDDPAWIRFDLGRVCELGRIGVAFVQGDTRQYIFSISASADGEHWTPIFDGRSSGRTTELEYFDVPGALHPLRARYVTITGRGNISEKFPYWVNITEVRILGN